MTKNGSYIEVENVKFQLYDEKTPLSPHRYAVQDGSEKPPSLSSATSANQVPSRSFSQTLAKHWNDYVSAVESHPVLTKSATAIGIFLSADLSAQSLEHFRGTSVLTGVDWPRAARFAAFGLFGAPWSHFYFYWLDHYFPPSDQPCSSTTVVKVCIDQFIQAPILLALMIVALSLMKGDGLFGAKRALGKTFVIALIANCKRKLSSLNQNFFLRVSL